HHLPHVALVVVDVVVCHTLLHIPSGEVNARQGSVRVLERPAVAQRVGGCKQREGVRGEIHRQRHQAAQWIEAPEWVVSPLKKVTRRVVGILGCLRCPVEEVRRTTEPGLRHHVVDTKLRIAR
ncbi:MAG: hypothetical protein K2K05_10230, partial [Muribaculaceae bacterium]|nr:hypothetical protein [Muribaculaceae bacterium]